MSRRSKWSAGAGEAYRFASSRRAKRGRFAYIMQPPAHFQRNPPGRGDITRDADQSSIGFQPVPTDHWACPAKSATSVGAAQNPRLIGAKQRLEAYATLRFDLAVVTDAPGLETRRQPKVEA